MLQKLRRNFSRFFHSSGKGPNCPVCDGKSSLLDVLDFNKSCEELRGTFLPASGVPVSYFLCSRCQFCFAPEISAWSLEEFAKRIYNDEYVLVDPNYIELRPKTNAASLQSMFGHRPPTIRHLDYGGGRGLLAATLKNSNWNSISYDPFENRDVQIEQLGKFDLITAFEVFEHVPDVYQLMSNLHTLLAPDGIVFFSTLVSDGNISIEKRLDWWYAAPRNGHISLFSNYSLALLGKKFGFELDNFSDLHHVFYTQKPRWFSQLIGGE